VRVGTFLDDTENTGAVVHRKNQRTTAATFSSQLSDANSHLDFYALAGNKADRHMEPFIIEINPSVTCEPIFSSHEGEEFIFVMRGNVKIIYGKDTYILQAGDSIYYDSIVEHLVSAADSESAQILAVVYAPF
jgi:mannose-6-phosphate isomerase-like protein (cupin superfamily)